MGKSNYDKTGSSGGASVRGSSYSARGNLTPQEGVVKDDKKMWKNPLYRNLFRNRKGNGKNILGV